MSDREEIRLRAKVDAALSDFAAKKKLATDAARARNLAKRAYVRALDALSKYHERQYKETH